VFKLYYKGQFISEHADHADAEAAARWTYFEFQSCAWEGENIPPGFLIACEGGKAAA
jgi:hypothetical protein